MNEKTFERSFKALANRRRLAILLFLKKRREATVGDIAEAIKLSFKSTSRHLAVLANAGVIDREQRSLNVFYHIADGLMKPVRTTIELL